MESLLLIVVGIALLLISLRLFGQPRAVDSITRWHTTIPQLEDDAQTCYARIYQGLKSGLEERQMELRGLGFGPMQLFETPSVFSARPLYFCAKYKHLTYYIYGTPTPQGLFLSTWMFSRYHRETEEKTLWGQLFSVWRIVRYLSRETLFQHDAVILFQELMHDIVVDVVESYRLEKQLPPLQDYEKRPVYSAFYQKDFPQPPLSYQTVMHPSAPLHQVPPMHPTSPVHQAPVMQPVASNGPFPQPSFPFQQHFAQPTVPQPTTVLPATQSPTPPASQPASSQHGSAVMPVTQTPSGTSNFDTSHTHHFRLPSQDSSIQSSPLPLSPLQAIFSDATLQPSGEERLIQTMADEQPLDEQPFEEHNTDNMEPEPKPSAHQETAPQQSAQRRSTQEPSV